MEAVVEATSSAAKPEAVKELSGVLDRLDAFRAWEESGRKGPPSDGKRVVVPIRDHQPSSTCEQTARRLACGGRFAPVYGGMLNCSHASLSWWTTGDDGFIGARGG